jgi:hypothetical protein
LEAVYALIETRYFTLSLESLQAIGGWAADCAERALSVYETHADSDVRPRAAIAGIREFAGGGKRTARLRTLALEAHAAAREIGDPAAAGPAAYAALAFELDHEGDPRVADDEIRWAIEHAPSEAREVLLRMPARQAGKSRLDTILYELDAGIRARNLPQDA